MKTKFLLAVLLLTIIAGCATPQHLPEPEAIGLNQYGSFIKVTHRSATHISGELIAVDSAGMVVLVQKSKKCLRIPISDIRKFNLQYAQKPNYGWSIPVFTLISLVHGQLAILTLPLNLIVSTAVTISGDSDFQYNNRNLSYHKLRMFARFPQGLPPNVDLASIQ